MTSLGENKTPCMLVILDLNPYFWGVRSLPETLAPATTTLTDDAPASVTQLHLSEFISVLLSYLNAYRLMNKATQIKVIACHLSGASLLLDSTHITGHFAKELTACVKQLAKSLVLPAAPASEELGYGSKIGAGLSLAVCSANKLIKDNVTPRIMVFSASPDLSEQYVAVMNCIFSAQKLKILIDSCVLIEQDSPLLQQAAYITGGVYMRPEHQREALIQYLLCAFLPDAETRQYLKVPLLKSVDFRASCFCHKRSENIAYVCSVCLSIFCTFKPVCPTCQVKFPFDTAREI